MATGPLLLLDSASLYYRSFFALPDSMTAPDGRPHNALRGFLGTLDALHRRFEPSGIVACWDDDWRPQWRVDLMPTYKAHRVQEGSEAAGWSEQEPDALTPQAQALADILDAAGVMRIGIAGFEADDVLASLASASTSPVVGVSGDRDLVQTVDDAGGARLLLAVNGGMPKWPLLDEAGVLGRFGVPTSAYVDLAIMRGDPSDGIPGVPGIGDKTAAALLAAHGDLDRLLAAAAEGGGPAPLTPRIASLLQAHAEDLRTARVVATARTDLDVGHALPGSIPQTAQDADTLGGLVRAWGLERFWPDWLPAYA
jgi:5'-3' exonuclease